MTTKEDSAVVFNNYPKLLAEIKNAISVASLEISKVATRQKVVMSWQIGQLIEENLLTEERSEIYGEKLFDQLEADLLIKKRVLYKMVNFYKSYPQLPKDDEKLNWSHYRSLAEIKDDEKRQYLQNLAIENNWSSNKLDTEIRKDNKTDLKSLEEVKKVQSKKKLTAIRGKLFTYPLIKLFNSDKKFIDCGFKIFKAIETDLKEEQIVEVAKNGEKYSLVSSNLPYKKLNIYKAYLERVVDGDTIRVILDLGFGIFHEEILRLKGINAAEIKTNEGKRSYKFLNDLLKDVPFLIVKTVKTDIYGRFVADVFLEGTENEKNELEIFTKHETSPQEVADNGIYLNQLLLDEGVVEMFED